uniref:Uncharacterized protein n=1 Tax=Oryza nivara TaxID=4536 RepID=A0A0E0G323_ORYNI
MHRVQARQPSVASAHRGILVYYCYSIQVAVLLSPPPYQAMLSSAGLDLVLALYSSCSHWLNLEDVDSTLIWWRRTPQPALLNMHGEAAFEVAAGSYDVAHASCYKCNRCNCQC